MRDKRAGGRPLEGHERREMHEPLLPYRYTHPNTFLGHVRGPTRIERCAKFGHFPIAWCMTLCLQTREGIVTTLVAPPDRFSARFGPVLPLPRAPITTLLLTLTLTLACCPSKLHRAAA